MALDLKSPVVLVGAALLVGALVLLRPRADVPLPPGSTPPSEPPAPTRAPGEETAARQHDIDEGERTGHALQDSGDLDEALDYDEREHALTGPGAVIVGNPAQGERDDPRIHKYACTDDVYNPVMRYFWQTLSMTGAGFGWAPPDGSANRYALVLVEQPRGTFWAPQLMPTEYLGRFPRFIQGWWVDPELTAADFGNAMQRAAATLAGAFGGAGDRDALVRSIPPSMPADSVSRMHIGTDRLVKITDLAGSGARLQGQPGVTRVTEHFPTWWIHHGEWLMRPSELWARSICPPSALGPAGLGPQGDGEWSLICCSEQGRDLGGSTTLSQYVTPVPYVFHRGYNPVVEGDCAATERNLYSIPAVYGPKRLARLHPKTRQPWRCFSFVRSREVPDNPAWSLVWWTPWYPQHRDDDSRDAGHLPRSFEPHLGGGSQCSAGFVQWVAGGLNQTGDKPAGQWIGNIPIGLPQDCVRAGERVKCDNRHAPDGDSPCGTVDGENLWQIGYSGADAPCPDPLAVVARDMTSGSSSTAAGRKMNLTSDSSKKRKAASSPALLAALGAFGDGK